MARSILIGPFHFQTPSPCGVFYLEQDMTDGVELKGVLEAALSEDGGIILIRNAMAEYQ